MSTWALAVLTTALGVMKMAMLKFITKLPKRESSLINEKIDLLTKKSKTVGDGVGDDGLIID